MNLFSTMSTKPGDAKLAAIYPLEAREEQTSQPEAYDEDFFGTSLRRIPALKWFLQQPGELELTSFFHIFFHAVHDFIRHSPLLANAHDRRTERCIHLVCMIFGTRVGVGLDAPFEMLEPASRLEMSENESVSQ